MNLSRNKLQLLVTIFSLGIYSQSLAVIPDSKTGSLTVSNPMIVEAKIVCWHLDLEDIKNALAEIKHSFDGKIETAEATQKMGLRDMPIVSIQVLFLQGVTFREANVLSDDVSEHLRNTSSQLKGKKGFILETGVGMRQQPKIGNNNVVIEEVSDNASQLTSLILYKKNNSQNS